MVCRRPLLWRGVKLRHLWLYRLIPCGSYYLGRKMAAVQTFVYLWSTVLWLPTFAIVVYEGGDACNKTDLESTCCGLYAFNKDSHFCCGGWPVELPVHKDNCDINWPAYKWMSQACDQGAHVEKPVPDKCAFNDGSEDFPSTGFMHFCCGGRIIADSLEKCEPMADDLCCGRMKYNIEYYFCCGNHLVVDPSGGFNEVSEYECKHPPAMDPNKQVCVGGGFLTVDAPECDGGEVHYCCGYEIRPKGCNPEPGMCGSVSYNPADSICCANRVYPSNAYICCIDQVQGKPIDPACCGKLAYSKLSHKCVDGKLKDL
ncbi:hypothetical protein LSAT2_001376 [Lamellibrachia satsuma]|nr:hypothetical protein LSAT2_001376 [Lamellibrachia satsuma]